jgi:hypothetical protein
MARMFSLLVLLLLYLLDIISQRRITIDVALVWASTME